VPMEMETEVCVVRWICGPNRAEVGAGYRTILLSIKKIDIPH
jgi:hypothetical protein